MRLLRSIPALAAALSFAVLSLAFVHEWAFYLVIGDHYQALMGVTDYFNSAIGWLPWVTLGGCLAAFWYLTDNLRHVPNAVKNEYYKQHPVIWFFNEGPNWMFRITWWLLFLVGLFQFLFGDWYTNFALMLVVAWFWYRTA